MLTNEQFIFVAEGCEGMELDAVWDYFAKPFGTRFLVHGHASFHARREAFLWVLRRLLDEHRIELVNMQTHKPIGGTVDEQVNRFRSAFPKDDAEMNNGIWFFTEACPGGSAWKPHVDEPDDRVDRPH
ncbi:DUF596 domain-containing protein [Variovorax humicola]|uniref:DUF596 domain-containing protein n=1 Tax=Variovorax humicola TaxID=1769758 RepID=A0ABU8VTM5_9BURK